MQTAVKLNCYGNLLIFFCCLFLVPSVLAAENGITPTVSVATNNSPTGASVTATNEQSAEALQQALRAYLLLQEQVHQAILAIETNRQESSAAVQRNAEVVSTRLKLIEQELSRQRERESDALQKSNRMMLIIAGIFGGVGLLAMILTAIFLVRTMNRLAEISTSVPKALPLSTGPQTTGLLGMDPGAAAVPPEATRLLGAIERLEKRIQELEAGTDAPQLLTLPKEPGQTNGKHEAVAIESEPVLQADADSGPEDLQERVSLIIGKGQTLLNLGQAENALVCFDEVLALVPDHAEALVKKGTALERLRRWEDALQCYDRAIGADSNMTLAYLYKGGVFNQLERFGEALECYEQALRTQQKAAVPA